LLGRDAQGLSAGTIGRLKEKWRKDLELWRKRDLRGKRYVYLWADGISIMQVCKETVADNKWCESIVKNNKRKKVD